MRAWSGRAQTGQDGRPGSFVRSNADGSYKKHLNRSNPMGTGGQLAEVYAELVKTIWYGGQVSISPVLFKVCHPRAAHAAGPLTRVGAPAHALNRTCWRTRRALFTERDCALCAAVHRRQPARCARAAALLARRPARGRQCRAHQAGSDRRSGQRRHQHPRRGTQARARLARFR